MTTETKATHTPGPWNYIPEADGRSRGYIRAGEPLQGAKLAPAIARACSQNHAENEANAYLIAAAPDMRAVLLRVHDSPHEPDKWQLEVAKVLGVDLPATLREEMEQRNARANHQQQVNADMLEALEALYSDSKEFHDTEFDPGAHTNCGWCLAKAAIAKATGKQ